MHVAKQTNGLRAVFLCLHDFRFSCKVLRFSKKDFERAVTQRHLVSLEGQASANALVKTLTKTGETS